MRLRAGTRQPPAQPRRGRALDLHGRPRLDPPRVRRLDQVVVHGQNVRPVCEVHGRGDQGQVRGRPGAKGLQGFFVDGLAHMLNGIDALADLYIVTRFKDEYNLSTAGLLTLDYEDIVNLLRYELVEKLAGTLELSGLLADELAVIQRQGLNGISLQRLQNQITSIASTPGRSPRRSRRSSSGS